MDTIDCITSKLDVREFAQGRKVDSESKKKILGAARLTGSSMNSQHWRFILIQEKPDLARLAEDSTTGKWVANADFAILILTDPKVPAHMIDAGRALQDMELAAWNLGIASCLYTGVNEENLRHDFGAPETLKASAILGFGYPKKRIRGRKNRKPLEEIAYSGRFGNKLSL